MQDQSQQQCNQLQEKLAVLNNELQKAQKKEKEYNNNISRMSLKLSHFISNTFDYALNYVFGNLENAMNKE